MLNRVLEIFYEISQIPHCSSDTYRLKKYIVNFVLSNGFDVFTDESGNILARLNNPKICLQSHYDMVCIGDTENLEIIVAGNVIQAKNSTLGADNGIGVAMMLALIEEKNDAEYLFTNDEEIGLVGAKNLKLDIKSKLMLNLDSEEEGKICIGCAGGFDFKVKIPLEKYSEKTNNLQTASSKLKKITSINFAGGHSGVEIENNIHNAIKEVVFFIKKNNMTLLNINGGERHNSIPVNVEAVVECDNKVESTKNIIVEEIKNYDEAYNCNEITSLLLSFPTGVRSWNKEYDIPHDSVNLAIINVTNGIVHIEISARSMDNDSLKKLEIEMIEFFREYEVEVNDGYPAWKPQLTDFAKKVHKVYKEEMADAELKVIHAGLECAVLKDILGDIDTVSIGPNIFSPHTDRERVEIDSVKKVLTIVKKILDDQ